MKELEVKIAAFIANKNVKTRSGVQHSVVSFQKDASGNVTALVGTVKEKIKSEEGIQEVDTPMMWTSNGNALCNQPMIYDLVEELTIDNLGK